MDVRVIDLDGVGGQPAIAARNPTVVPARDLAPRVRLWAGRRAMAELAHRIANVACSEPSITFLGSGDFHHIAPLLIGGCSAPVVVLHIDNHPDWVKLAPRGHCGAWVNRALELPNVLKVITVGPTSPDLDRPDLSGGAFTALRDGRIELYPWERPPSRLWRTLPSGPGHKVQNGALTWRCIGGEDWPKVCEDLTARVPPDAAVWFSIDKDVLRPEEAVTNWDQGRMPLSVLEQLIAVFGRSRRIAGADICGDWSAPVYDTVIKAWEARFDRPRTPLGDLTINARTNARLLEAFEKVLG